jgi:hypothetical protein
MMLELIAVIELSTLEENELNEEFSTKEEEAEASSLLDRLELKA